jgi:hypothetical protein
MSGSLGQNCALRHCRSTRNLVPFGLLYNFSRTTNEAPLGTIKSFTEIVEINDPINTPPGLNDLYHTFSALPMPVGADTHFIVGLLLEATGTRMQFSRHICLWYCFGLCWIESQRFVLFLPPPKTIEFRQPLFSFLKEKRKKKKNKETHPRVC